MKDIAERSAYPPPRDFEVMRPEYADLEDGTVAATISVAPYKVEGQSVTRAGARRAAVYEAHLTYKHYNPSYRPPCPFPDEFGDQEGVQWKRMSILMRATTGDDYMFSDEDGEEDYASIKQMLIWDVRPVQ